MRSGQSECFILLAIGVGIKLDKVAQGRPIVAFSRTFAGTAHSKGLSKRIRVIQSCWQPSLPAKEGRLSENEAGVEESRMRHRKSSNDLIRSPGFSHKISVLKSVLEANNSSFSFFPLAMLRAEFLSLTTKRNLANSRFQAETHGKVGKAGRLE